MLVWDKSGGLKEALQAGLQWNADPSLGGGDLRVKELPTLDGSNVGHGAFFAAGCYGEVYLGEGGVCRALMLGIAGC